MSEVIINIGQKVFFGVDEINRIGNLISEVAERVLIVTEAILYEKKIIETVQDLLQKKGIKYITFDEVIPNATSTIVDKGIKLAKVSCVDTIVGLGGIRTLCTAKAIAMAAPVTSCIDDFLTGKKPEGKPLIYIEIPTTCRNPFMLTDDYLITDARNRQGHICKAQEGITKLVIIDPCLSSSLPLKYTATTILDTLLCASEAYLSNYSNFLSDILFSQVIILCKNIIFKLIENPEDISHRIKASKCGLLAAIGLTMSKAGAGTALAYSLNSNLMVPKSWIASVLLPHIFEYYSSLKSIEKIGQIAELMGEPIEGYTIQEASQKAVDIFRRLLGTVHLPTRLRDFDLKIDDIIKASEEALSYDMISGLPVNIGVKDLNEIIKAAY